MKLYFRDPLEHRFPKMIKVYSPGTVHPILSKGGEHPPRSRAARASFLVQKGEIDKGERIDFSTHWPECGGSTC